MGNAERTEPLTLVGPKGLERVVTALRTIAPELPFPLRFVELQENRQQLKLGPYVIDAYRVNHNVVCYGYTISIPRAGKFDLERAKAQNVPMKAWSRLQKGETVEMDGAVYTPDMVLGAERPGIAMAYCTDSRPVDRLAHFAKGVQLFICEGMYGEEEKKPKALEHKHMLFSEAARLAKFAEAEELWLTHFSPALQEPAEFLQNATDIFPNTLLGEERKMTTLYFPKEG